MSNIFIKLPALSGTALQSSISATLEEVTFKGAPSIMFVLTGIDESKSKALTLDINWGDNSNIEYYQRDVVYDYREQSILNEVLYGKIGGSVLEEYEHTYTPTLSTQVTSLSVQFLIYFNDGFFANIFQPIRLLKESYYDSIEKLGILNTQMIGTSASNTIANLQSRFNKRTYTTFFDKDWLQQLASRLNKYNEFFIYKIC